MGGVVKRMIASTDLEGCADGGAGGPHVLLFMIVRNEAKILERCLDAAAPFVDAVLVVDTGSTDDTMAVARAYAVRRTFVVQHEWRDFGHNRTLSCEAARRCCVDDLGWRLEDTYGLTLDADMLLRGDPALWRDELTRLREHGIGGALVSQTQGVLEYTNVRAMRLADPWRCVGATHEFWTDDARALFLVAPQVLRIDDVDDGGCKEDKLERDERLLLAGLADPAAARAQHPCLPGRYAFYLAQTYVSQKRYELACEYFKRRIEDPEVGWLDEVWYSWYQMGRVHYLQDQLDDADRCLREALAVQPERAEALVLLCDLGRRRGDVDGAWAHLLRAEALPKPQDHRLFLEPAAYAEGQLLQRALLAAQCPQSEHTDAARSVDACLGCLALDGQRAALALACLAANAAQLPGARARLAFATPLGYVASSASLSGDLLCVRAVNYLICADGSYDLPQGFVGTRNFLARWKGLRDPTYAAAELLELQVDSATPRRDDGIRGLEDVRLQGPLFTATTREYSYCAANRMVLGVVLLAAPAAPAAPAATARVFAVRPPEETACEKNWLLLPTAQPAVIYGWHPLSLFAVEPPGADGVGSLRPLASHATPPWWQHLRGSAPPFLLRGKLWVLAHLAAPTRPRCYLHCWLWLDPATCRPLAWSRPFWFFHRGVEYCLGAAPQASFAGGVFDSVLMLVSVLDRETWAVSTPIEALEALMLA